jgi:hypothetical protein
VDEATTTTTTTITEPVSKKREFASVEDEALFRRSKYNARTHKSMKIFASFEEEVAFYRRRNARKRDVKRKQVSSIVLVELY